MKVDLNGKWVVKRLSDNTEFTGIVPGSVMNDLLENNLTDDPFFRDNEYRAYEIFRSDFVYSRDFVLDEKTISSDSLNLVCEGLDTLAEISINGKFLAYAENMHRTFVLDIREWVHTGKNTIEIIFKSPVDFIERAWKDRGPIWGVCAKDGYQFIRKAHYMFGWDWGPAIPDCGIWRDIYIESFNEASIEDVYIRQTHSDNSVILNFESRINLFKAGNPELEIILYNPDDQQMTSVQSISGKATITIDNPDLWWPAGYGRQPLYRVAVVLHTGGHVLDSREYRIGLRTLGVRMDNDQWGQTFTYNVNGIDVFAKGANYIPEDSVLARCSEGRTRELLEQAAMANFNSIRVWGGGIYPENHFYEICDELGLMVWQDFMFACAQYSLDDEKFVESIKYEISDNIKRLRHHASLALWCGNNEMEWLWVDTQTEGRSREQMDEYLELFEGIIPPIASKEDPDRLYWPASPSSGGNFDAPNDENRGDVHYWDVWHGLKPFTEYRKFFFRFCSEFGFQSFPCLKTVESYTIPEDRNIFSYVMESHQKNSGANGKILYYLSENFKNPKDFESLLYVSQLLQAEAIKYGVEHWRRNRGRCMGSIYWQFNDCWPVASWSGIDSFHRWKALHYFAKRFYSQVLVSAEDNGSKVNIHISNESMDDTTGNIEWKLMDRDGDILESGKHDVMVEGLSSRLLISLDFTARLSDMNIKRRTILWYEYTDNSGVRSEASVLFVPNKYFMYKKPGISVEVIKTPEKDGLKLTTESYAGYVSMESSKYDFVFSDNFFSLAPGCEKIVTLEKSSTDQMNFEGSLLDDITVTSLFDSF